MRNWRSLNRRRRALCWFCLQIFAVAQRATHAGAGDGGPAGQAAAGTKGVVVNVRTPDGRPAASAKIAVGVAESQILIKNGDIDDWSKNCTRGATDDAGRFHFAPVDGTYWLVVTHLTGFAWLKCTAELPAGDIRLNAWAQVEGTFRVGRKLQPNVPLRMNVDGQELISQKNPLIFTAHTQTTDRQGRFVFERVVPGEGRIGRVVSNLNEPHGTSSSCMIAATFPAGKTAHIDLGTTGRPVIGRLKLPGNSHADNPWSFVLLLVRPSDLQLSETGPRFSGTVNRDGNFCIDDVPAGEYWLLIHFAKSRRRRSRAATSACRRSTKSCRSGPSIWVSSP